ncbi:MAG: ATP-dependent helicase [Actinobacteria bacterium]|nr:ATP-dependent helicase [Actinomycetota bacterium]
MGHVTVDEYQDTDPAQQRLLEAIVGEGSEICVVGDPRQAIYRWKGADPSYLTGFALRYPGAKVFDLTRNYRSTPQVLGWVNLVAKEPGTKPLVATRPAGAKPSLACYDDEQAEADAVVKATREALAAGTPPSDLDPPIGARTKVRNTRQRCLSPARIGGS